MDLGGVTWYTFVSSLEINPHDLLNWEPQHHSLFYREEIQIMDFFINQNLFESWKAITPFFVGIWT